MRASIAIAPACPLRAEFAPADAVRADSVPSSAAGASALQSAAGLMLRAWRLPCQAPSAVPPPGNRPTSPSACRWPPPSSACSASTRQRSAVWVSVACRRCNGRRWRSAGPLALLRRSTCARQASPSGAARSVPESAVSGAWGHRLDRSSWCAVASALCSGCSAQGMTRAVAASVGVALAGSPLGSTRACTSSAAPAPASVPLARALACSGIVLPSGTWACTVPSACSHSGIGACAPSTPCNW